MLYKEIQNLENAARTAMSGSYEHSHVRPLKYYNNRALMRTTSALIALAIISLTLSIYLLR